MSLLNQAFTRTMSVSGGTVSETHKNMKNRKLAHLFIKPANDTVSYTVAITDENSFTVFEYGTIKKKLNITDHANLPAYVWSNFTLTITADADVDFEVLFVPISEI